MSQTDELVSQIRESINEPRKRLAISQDDTDWFRLCSSLDVIGDSEMAFHAYNEMPNSDHPGANYILVYGFLQTLFLQQDAVNNLHKALGIPYEIDSTLREIRNVRNAVIHPTDGGLSSEKRFRFISRMSLSKSGFELWTVVPNKSSREFEEVSLVSLLEKQHLQMENALRALLKELKKEEIDYRKRYMDESLEDCYPQALDYFFEKILEAVRGDSSVECGEAYVSLISEILENFKSALDKRKILGAYLGIDSQLEQLEDPLQKLAQIFENKGEKKLNATDAYSLTKFVQSGVTKLQNMASEIDEEIAVDPKSA